MKRFFAFLIFASCGWAWTVSAAPGNVDITVQLGHTNQVINLAISPNGRLIAAADNNGAVRVWEKASGRELWWLNRDGEFITSLKFSPDSRLLQGLRRFMGSGSRLWDMQTGTLVAQTEQFHDLLGFSPDGRLLVSQGKEQYQLAIADARDGKTLRVLPMRDAFAQSGAFMPDGTLIVGEGDGAIQLWDPDTGSEIATLNLPKEGVNRGSVQLIALSPDGNLMATIERVGIVDVQNVLKLWSLPDGRLLANQILLQAAVVTDIAFAPDGKFLATLIVPSGGGGNRLVMRDPKDGHEIRSFASELPIHFAFSPDGQWLVWVIESNEGDIHYVNLANSLERHFRIDSRIGSLNFDVSGRTLIAGGDKIITLWDTASGHIASTLKGALQPVEANYSPDSNLLVEVHSEGISLRDAHTGEVLRNFPQYNSAAVSPDGKTLAAGLFTGEIKLIDIVSGQELQTLAWRSPFKPGVDDGAFFPARLSFSADGSSLFSVCFDRVLRTWDVKTGKLQNTFNMNIDDILGWGNTFIIPEHNLFAVLTSGIFDHKGYRIHLFDFISGRELWQAETGKLSNREIALSPDGRLLVAGGIDFTDWKGRARLFETASGREIMTLPNQGKTITALAFSPDSSRIASGSSHENPDGGTVKIWDAANGNELLNLPAHFGDVKSINFSPDGTTLVTSGDDGTSKIWDAKTGALRLTLADFGGGEWIAITPDGYYTASENGDQYLNVRIGDQVSSIGQYREKFYRPDLVKLALSGGSLTQFARLDQVKPAPRVELLDVPATTGQAQITVKVQLTDAGGGFGDVRLFLNGSAIVQEKARNLTVQQTQSGGVVQSYTVRLVNGKNEIKAVAFNAENSMQSNPATAEINASFVSNVRPSLHAVIVGIQEFKNPQFKLNYPVADAKLFADTLKQNATSLFQTVDINLLTTPAETSRENILQTLTNLRQKVGPEDLFVFFVASHGTVDDGEYFLITSNVGSASTEKLKADALSQKQLREMIANIPATKKLVVIDTCNAGALGDTLQVAMLTRGMSDVTAMKILGRSMGSTVLSASTSTQEALEGYKGHGLFTYVVADGLAGKADTNHDGFVSTLELATYVDEQVPALAEKVFNHAQYPVVSPSGQGFPLTKANAPVRE